MRTWSIILTASLIFCCFTTSSEAQANGGGAVLDNISSQFTSNTKKWESTIKGHAVKLFWKIFLGFGSSEWTRDMSVGYYKTLLAYGVKLMLTLLLAGIGLDIIQNLQKAGGQGWGTDLAQLCNALAGTLILLGIIAKAPDGVASMAGFSTGGFGHGVGTFMAAAGMGYRAGAWVGSAAAEGGKQLGQAIRNAVKQGQTLSRGR